LPILKNVGNRTEYLSDAQVRLEPGESTNKVDPILCIKLARDTKHWSIAWEDCKHKEGKTLYLTATIPVHPTEGYGTYSIHSLLGLEQHGVRISSVNGVHPSMRESLTKMYPGIVELIEREPKYPTRWGIAFGYPNALDELPTEHRVLSTMYESTQVPSTWDEPLKTADIIIVPAESQIEIFRSSGCTQPMYAVPIGIDVSEYAYKEREEKDTFTFVSWSRMSSRKCPNETLIAFWKAFPVSKYPDVRLIMKTRNHDFGVGRAGIPAVADSRVTIIDEEWETWQLAKLAHEADAACFLSHGEGFFMPPLQAMATGLPVIAPTHSGCSAWADDKYCYTVGLDPHKPLVESPLGMRDYKPLLWWNCDMEQVSHLMRHIYDNRDEAKAKGKKAASYVRRKFSREVMVKELLGVMRKLS